MSRPPSTVPTREELLARLEESRRRSEQAEKIIAEREEEILKLRALSVETQRVAEIEEERMGNTLLKRMDSLKHQNSELEKSIKRDERQNAAVLSELAKVRKSKVEVENRIEQEQERMLNTLQKQLIALATEKTRLERQLHANREEVLAALQSEVERLHSRNQTPLGGGASSADTSMNLNSARSDGSTGSPVTRPRRNSVLDLESELRQLLEETREAQAACEQSDQQCKKLSDNLRELQNDTFLARARTAKIKEELERAQADLALERASATETPIRGSSDVSTPLLSGPAVVPQANSPSINNISVRRGHGRTMSGSSVESWSSATGAAPVNTSLVRADPESVRQHTARVLSSTTLAYPAPQRGSRASSAHQAPTGWHQ